MLMNDYDIKFGVDLGAMNCSCDDHTENTVEFSFAENDVENMDGAKTYSR